MTRRLLLVLSGLFFAFPALAAEGEYAAVGFKSLLLLLVIVVALFGLAWGLKRYGPVAQARKSLGLTVVGQVGLNQKSSLALVRVGRSLLLVGVSPGAVTLIKDLEGENFEGAIEREIRQ